MNTKTLKETVTGPLIKGQRWSAGRKREVIRRLLGGESMHVLSRELSVKIYRLEQWREQALAGIDASMQQRQSEPLPAEFNQAMRWIGELAMENELFWERVTKSGPLATRRSSK